MTTTNSRKVLVPLATLLAAGAVAIGSGADFSSEATESKLSVTAGTLAHTNTQDGMTLEITDLKPGDSQSGTLTIENSGTLDSELAVTETGSANDFPGNMLQLEIVTSTGLTVYDNEFGGLGDAEVKDLGDLAVGDSMDVTFTVSLAEAADNEAQGDSAGATFEFVTTQVDEDESDSSWVPTP